MKTAYKFLRTRMRSDYDGSDWKLGEWRQVDAPTVECRGLNASELIPDALHYVQGEILARVEYKGTVVTGGDKVTCEYMRVVETWPWTKRMSVQLAVFAARRVLALWERRYPDDARPRTAIEAAESWLADNGSTARAAARAADAARAAARAAAADAAAAAAWAAAGAAAAAWAGAGAEAAAGAAAAAEAGTACHRYVLTLLKEAK